MFKKGMQHAQTHIVTDADTARAMGSGDLDVYATPAMIALMESTALHLAAPCLAPGESTVGTMIQAEHVSASPVGMQVHCEAELTGISGRVLTFSITARDSAGLIGKALHTRCIINADRFYVKTKNKM